MVHLVEVKRDSASYPISALSTAELSRRPSRPPDYESENRALITLAKELATAPDVSEGGQCQSTVVAGS
jgi:hypothetical protein